MEAILEEDESSKAAAAEPTETTPSEDTTSTVDSSDTEETTGVKEPILDIDTLGLDEGDVDNQQQTQTAGGTEGQKESL